MRLHEAECGGSDPDACQGEVICTKEDGSVELQVSAPALAKPMVYAFDSTDSIAAFLEQLAADLGVAAADVYIRTPSGAAMSSSMSHSFAWKPGRIVSAGAGVELAVSIVSVDDGEIDHFAPSVSGPRSSSRVKSQVHKMKYASSPAASSLPGQGRDRLILGVLMSGGLPRHVDQDRPVPQRRRGHHVAL